MERPRGDGIGCDRRMPTITVEEITPSPVPLLRRDEHAHLDRAVRSGELARVARGVYAPRELWANLPPWDRYLSRVHAAASRYPHAVFVRDSAAALRGLPVFGEPAWVHAINSGAAPTRRVGDVIFHSAERMPQHEQRGGIEVATMAEVAIDAARLRHPAVGLAIVDAALRRTPDLSTGRLRALSETHPSSRGRARARWVMDRASPTPESPLESVSLAVIEWQGFPPPQCQVWFRGGGDDDRVDFAWPQWGIAGEADGEIKYSGELGDARGALRARGIRDARLMRRGISTIRHWGWQDLVAPDLLRTILASAGLPIIRPAAAGPLRTLAAALRGAP